MKSADRKGVWAVMGVWARVVLASWLAALSSPLLPRSFGLLDMVHARAKPGLLVVSSNSIQIERATEIRREMHRRRGVTTHFYIEGGHTIARVVLPLCQQLRGG